MHCHFQYLTISSDLPYRAPNPNHVHSCMYGQLLTNYQYVYSSRLVRRPTPNRSSPRPQSSLITLRSRRCTPRDAITGHDTHLHPQVESGPLVPSRLPHRLHDRALLTSPLEPPPFRASPSRSRSLSRVAAPPCRNPLDRLFLPQTHPPARFLSLTVCHHSEGRRSLFSSPIAANTPPWSHHLERDHFRPILRKLSRRVRAILPTHRRPPFSVLAQAQAPAVRRAPTP